MRDRPDAAFLLALARQAATDGEAPEPGAAPSPSASAPPAMPRSSACGGRWRSAMAMATSALCCGGLPQRSAPAPPMRPAPSRRRCAGPPWAMTREKLAESNPDYLAAAAAAGAAPG